MFVAIKCSKKVTNAVYYSKLDLCKARLTLEINNNYKPGEPGVLKRESSVSNFPAGIQIKDQYSVNLSI